MESNYRFELTKVPEAEWRGLLAGFSDATLYQTYAYGAIRWGEKNLQHAILRRGEEVVSICQFRLISLPLYGTAIAYANRGPLWRRQGPNGEIPDVQTMLGYLSTVLANDRRCVLRLQPNEDGETPEFLEKLREAGFVLNRRLRPYRTLRIDLRSSLEDIRKQFKSGWRYNLGKAERAPLTIIEGTGLDLYDVFVSLYREMHARKGFAEHVSIDEFRRIQKRLPEEEKLGIVVCQREQRSVAAVVFSAIGDTGIPIFSASSEEGRKCGAAYLLRWHVLKRVRERGCVWLDQGGVNPELNPGGYQFKSGMGGSEANYIGQFESRGNALVGTMLDYAERLRRMSLQQLFGRHGKSTSEAPKAAAAGALNPGQPSGS